jgi:hypothetical protein
MTAILAFATILLPIVTGVTQLFKQTISMSKNLVPIVALGIGLLIGWLAAPLTDLDWILRLWAGGFAGLASTGLFELAFNPRSSEAATYNKPRDELK